MQNRYFFITATYSAPNAVALLSRAMEAKRRALDEIAARQRTADEKRQQEVERQQQAAVVSQSVVVQ
jgi:hypothetical protein